MRTSPHSVLLVKGNYVRAGGPETLLESTFTWLDRRRFEPTLILLRKSSGPEAPGLLRKAGPARREIVWRGIAAAPLVARALNQVARERGAALVDSHDMRASLAAYLLTRRLRRPWIARVHGWLGTTHAGRWRLYERIDRSLVKRADLVLVGCEAARQEAEALGVGPVKVVRQGVEIPPPVPRQEVQRLRDQMGAGVGTVVVGVVGRLHPGKGQQFILRAIAQLRERGLDVRGLFVGEGSSLKMLRDLARDLGVDGAVTLAGFQPNLLPYVAAMDVFVAASLKEGLSLAMLEAMVLGRPVVASQVGGLPEAVTHAETGFLVPPGDVPALTEALDPLVRDAGLRQRMGERAREVVLAEFTAEAMVRSLERAYAEVIAGNGWGRA